MPGSKRQSLYCIRCGACLNTCPVYRKTGGHSYPWVYSDPIGAILTPQFMGMAQEPALPFASSLCGACGEVCPVKIDIPQVLLDLRSEIKQTEAAGPSRLEKLAFRIFAWIMIHPRVFEMVGWMGRTMGVPSWKAGPLGAWLSGRDLPQMPARSFREQWRRRRRRAKRYSTASAARWATAPGRPPPARHPRASPA